MPRRRSPAIPDALLDQLLDGADPRTAFQTGRRHRRTEEGAGRTNAERHDRPFGQCGSPMGRPTPATAMARRPC